VKEIALDDKLDERYQKAMRESGEDAPKIVCH
jgi:hypothetical protein